MTSRTRSRCVLVGAGLLGAVAGALASYPRPVAESCYPGPCGLWTNSLVGGIHGLTTSLAIAAAVTFGATVVIVIVVNLSASRVGRSGRSAALLLGVATIAGSVYGAALGVRWFSGPSSGPFDIDCYVARGYLRGGPCVTSAMQWTNDWGHTFVAEPQPYVAALVVGVGGGLIAAGLWSAATTLRSKRRSGLSRAAA